MINNVGRWLVAPIAVTVGPAPDASTRHCKRAERGPGTSAVTTCCHVRPGAIMPRVVERERPPAGRSRDRRSQPARRLRAARSSVLHRDRHLVRRRATHAGAGPCESPGGAALCADRHVERALLTGRLDDRRDRMADQLDRARSRSRRTSCSTPDHAGTRRGRRRDGNLDHRRRAVGVQLQALAGEHVAVDGATACFVAAHRDRDVQRLETVDGRAPRAAPARARCGRGVTTGPLVDACALRTRRGPHGQQRGAEHQCSHEQTADALTQLVFPRVAVRRSGIVLLRSTSPAR